MRYDGYYMDNIFAIYATLFVAQLISLKEKVALCPKWFERR